MRGTVLCVHGNPSWSYLWRSMLETLSPEWRVVAVDQSGMGFSERAGPRTLAQRIDELVAFATQEVTGPLVVAAHDWGGAIAVGASPKLDPVALVLSNTAVAKPDDVAVPPLIAASRRFVDLICYQTSAFVDGAAAMTDRRHRAALRAPYRQADRRRAVAEFVADIPVIESDASSDALAGVATAFGALSCPILLVWGGKDMVFHDRFLADLRRRRPDADVHRYASASHFAPLDVPIGALVRQWLDDRLGDEESTRRPEWTTAQTDALSRSTLLDEVDRRAGDDAVLYRGPDATLTWRQLDDQSRRVAHHLIARGVRSGDRVALVVPPGAELLMAACGVWRAGGVLVVADASAGLRRLRSLLRASAPRAVIGTPTTLVAARVMGMAPAALPFCFGPSPRAHDLRAPFTAATVIPDPPGADDLAAIVHTSGATGPAKPVRYRHRALMAQRAVVAEMLALGPEAAFTTSFAPFLLVAPVLGSPCVLADFPIDAPGRLDFDALAAVMQGTPVDAAWLSPASARAIVASAGGRTLALTTTLLAGAPIPRGLAAGIARVTEGAVRTPYGMTECLPVTDGTEWELVGPHGGTATGRPVAGCEIRIEPLPDGGEAPFGQILVSAPWMFDGYEARWEIDRHSSVMVDGVRFHRTGDVGYLHNGVLFQLGRLAHVLSTPSGPVSSIAVETPIEEGLGRSVAVVGVGPPGAQRIVVVIGDGGHLQVAEQVQTDWVRSLVSCPVAAVLCGSLPVDIRHASKIDRSTLAASVRSFLDGR